jgi:hypothetical protein
VIGFLSRIDRDPDTIGYLATRLLLIRYFSATSSGWKTEDDPRVVGVLSPVPRPLEHRLPDADLPRPAVVVAMCSAADDPTTYGGLYGKHGVAVMGRPYAGTLDEARLESAIARRNIAWVAWQWEADDLVNRITDGERAPYGPYNDAQKAYEHAVSDLMREQARWRHSRHG